jgi:hypothetical protein
VPYIRDGAGEGRFGSRILGTEKSIHDGQGVEEKMEGDRIINLKLMSIERFNELVH